MLWVENEDRIIIASWSLHHRHLSLDNMVSDFHWIWSDSIPAGNHAISIDGACWCAKIDQSIYIYRWHAATLTLQHRQCRNSMKILESLYRIQLCKPKLLIFKVLFDLSIWRWMPNFPCQSMPRWLTQFELQVLSRNSHRCPRCGLNCNVHVRIDKNSPCSPRRYRLPWGIRLAQV